MHGTANKFKSIKIKLRHFHLLTKKMRLQASLQQQVRSAKPEWVLPDRLTLPTPIPTSAGINDVLTYLQPSAEAIKKILSTRHFTKRGK